MQPGMPLGFGLVEGKPFFGLPSNPCKCVRRLRDDRPAGDPQDDGPPAARSDRGGGPARGRGLRSRGQAGVLPRRVSRREGRLGRHADGWSRLEPQSRRSRARTAWPCCRSARRPLGPAREVRCWSSARARTDVATDQAGPMASRASSRSGRRPCRSARRSPSAWSRDDARRCGTPRRRHKEGRPLEAAKVAGGHGREAHA